MKEKTIRQKIQEELASPVRSKSIEQIRSFEASQYDTSGKFHDSVYGYDVEIMGKSKYIQPKGVYGIEIFARAWKDGVQVGFGKDGKLEIERFRIFNPPTCVPDDVNGEIKVNKIHPITKLPIIRAYRESPIEAIRSVIAHNIKVVGKIGSTIEKGSIGNTTDTFYPSMDGWCRRVSVNETFSTIRAGAGNGSNTSNADSQVALSASGTLNQYSNMARSFVLFDTASLPDTDTIDSGTFSLIYHDSSYIVNSFTLDTTALRSIRISGATPASDSSLANSDFANVSSTNYATADLSIAGLTANNSTYNDWTLSASGLAAISATGKSKFSVRTVFDADNTAPTWIASANCEADHDTSEEGASTDPKLVIVHSAAASGQNSNYLMRRR